MSTGRPRILYVEDDATIGEMTHEVLVEQFDVAWERDFEHARDALLRTPFDAVILDRRLPGGDGLDLVTVMRRAHLRTPVLLLTALDAIDERVAGLDAGANDYLVKPFDFEELLARVRALVRGFRADGVRREIGAWTFLPAAQLLHGPGGERVSLTATESALLELLSGSPERVFARDEILAAVFDVDDTPGIVDTYVHYVRRKTSPEVITTVRSRGYQVGG